MFHVTGSWLVGISVAIFVATLALVVLRPRGLSIGTSATGGALVALVVGVVQVSNLKSVWEIVWNPTVTFVALIVISLIMDRAGFFKWAALHLLARSRGSVSRAFVYQMVLGALVASLFANDGAALILTPIVYHQMTELGVERKKALPFVMAAGFIADTTSIPFVVSNLVNIISANYFHVGFVSYAKVMAPVDLVAFASSVLVLWVFYRHSMPKDLDVSAISKPSSAIVDGSLFRFGLALIGIISIGYILSEPLRFPVSIPASACAVAFVVVAGRSQVVSVRDITRRAPWNIVVFSVGMYLVVYGLFNAGLTAGLSKGLIHASHLGLLPATLIGGFATAGLSAVMNNLPATLVGSLSIHGAHLHGLARTAFIYANVVGADLGPKFTPLGSLATLLWLHVLETRGVKITWRAYTRQGIILTVPVLAVTLVGLVGWLEIVR